MAHGDHCDCQVLALAVGAPVSAVDYNYCRNVLQRHWRVVCRHAEEEVPPVRMSIPVPTGADIKEIKGPLKAILIEYTREPCPQRTA